MILTLILSAIVSLLVFFFERWWATHHPINPTPAKQEFLAEVARKKHFWMGKRRVEYAGKIFDKFAARFDANPPKLFTGTPLTQEQARTLAKSYADGLTLSDNELTSRRLGDEEHQFNVLSNGLVKGGTAAYSLDAATGKITYRASIKVGKWFLTKTYDSSGTYQVDPTLLNPTNLSVGRVITLDPVQMRVVSLGQNSALLSMTVNGQSATGSAIVLTSQPVVVLTSLDATVSVMGMTLSIGLRPV